LKTTQVTISWTIQQLINNPDLRILITNERLDNSKAFLREIKTHFEKNLSFISLYGDYVNDDSKWTETQIIIKTRTKILKEPTIQVGSLDTSLVSQHYDIIIGDDLVSRNNVGTKEQMDKVKQYWKDLQSLLEPGGILIDVGTRWAVDDLHGTLLEQSQYANLVLGCYDKQGEPVFPEKFSKEALQLIEKEIGNYDFACLWVNDPVDDQNAAFKRSFFENRYTDEMLKGKQLNTFITIDNAPSTKTGTDYIGIVANSVDTENNWYLRLVLRFKGNTPELIQKIIELYLYWKPLDIGVEQKAFDDLIKPFLKEEMSRRNIFFSVKELKDKGIRKEDRIRGRLQARFENSKIWLKKDPTDNTEDLVDELIRFPRSQFDDLCLSEGTRIATAMGYKNIENIKKGDRVITPYGLKRVLESKYTGEKEVIERCGLIGTPEHKVYTNNGFAFLDTIECNEVSRLSLKNLLQWKYKKLLYSMGNSITLWERESIILVQNETEKIQKDSIQQFGSFITKRQFRKGGAFTIKTATLLTTTLATWIVFQGGNTIECLKRLMWKKGQNIYQKLDHWQVSGTNQKKEDNGTENTGKNLLLRKNKKEYVGNAIKNIKLVLKWLQSFAVGNVKGKIKQENGEKDTQITTKRKVYNLTVEEIGVYYANDILVSNCDALQYQDDIAYKPYFQQQEEVQESKNLYNDIGI